MTDFIQRNIYILLNWDNTAWGDDVSWSSP